MIDYQQLALICEDSYNHDDFHLKSGTQGTVSRVGSYNVVSVRGTEANFEDILTDIRAIPWWSSELNRFCHKGFLLAAREVVPIVNEFDGPTILTGHSLGGAVVEIAGAITNRHSPIVTFGAPRAIVGRVDRAINPLSRRFVNGNDCVPSHPWPIWGYRHQSSVNQIGTQGHKFVDHKISRYVKEVSTAP